MFYDLPVRKAPRLELPYELEREIFELTARAHPTCAPSLALVSRYVQKWVEAVMYELIVLGAYSQKQDLFWRTFSSRPAAFFAQNVRTLHLSTGVSYSQAREIIAVCTNLFSLTCWANPLTYDEEFCALLPPSLRRLSINASALWPSTTDPTRAPDLTRPLFARLTHLELVNPPSWYDWTPLLAGLLPHLTHLALGDLDAAHSVTTIALFHAALESTAPRLEMLVAVSQDARFLGAFEAAGLREDRRVVCMPSYHHPFSPTEYWDAVARGECQFWRRMPDGEPAGPLRP